MNGLRHHPEGPHCVFSVMNTSELGRPVIPFPCKNHHEPTKFASRVSFGVIFCQMRPGIHARETSLD